VPHADLEHAQVEAAQRRAPFEERKEKKRKRTGDAPATTDEAPTATAAAALPSSPQQPPAAAEAAASPAAEPKPRKPKKQRVGQRPAEQKQMGENAKHALVRTVALGNLSAGNREQALAYALSNTGAHSVVQPSQADLDSHVLQRDGCAGNIVFLVYPTVWLQSLHIYSSQLQCSLGCHLGCQELLLGGYTWHIGLPACCMQAGP
jgi:hypothetical protein